MNASTSLTPATSPRRKGFWLCCMLGMLLLAVVFHVPLLRGIQAGLVHDEPAVTTDYTVILFGDRASMDAAKDRLKTGQTQQAIVLEMQIPRTVTMGLAPRLGDVVREQLQAQGCQESQIQVQTTHAQSMQEALRRLQMVLPPNRTVSLLSPHDRTGYLHMVLNKVFVGEERRRWHVASVAVYGYPEATWWYSREGWKRVSSAWLRQAHLWWFGEPPPVAPWNPDDYERSLAVASS